jgi:hypothetical protein
MMSNLSWYQTITTISKKVGGPQKLLLIVLGGGALIGIGVENGVKTAVKAIQRKMSDRRSIDSRIGKEFVVIADGKDDSGLSLSIGDRYHVMEIDEDAILIEKTGDTNNPYFTSSTFLASVSSFEVCGNSSGNIGKLNQLEDKP